MYLYLGFLKDWWVVCTASLLWTDRCSVRVEREKSACSWLCRVDGASKWRSAAANLSLASTPLSGDSLAVIPFWQRRHASTSCWYVMLNQSCWKCKGQDCLSMNMYMQVCRPVSTVSSNFCPIWPRSNGECKCKDCWVSVDACHCG